MGKALKRSVAFTMALMLVFVSIATFVTDETFGASKTHLKKKAISLEAGDTYQQKLILSNGKTVKSTKVKWKSCYTRVATISSTGKITAKYHGTAKLKATYKGRTYTFRVTVTDYGFKYSQYTIDVGKSKVVKLCKYLPEEEISPQKVDFWSENENIATVSSDGKVNGIAGGDTKVWAEYKGKMYSCKIHVYIPPKTGSVTCITPLPCACISNSGVVFRVDSLNGKLEYKGSLLRINIEGVCTGILPSSYGGTKTEGYGRINYRVYDSKGYVVDSGSFTTDKVRVGDRIKLQKSVFPEGYLDSSINLIDDYTIEIYGDVSTSSAL